MHAKKQKDDGDEQAPAQSGLWSFLNPKQDAASPGTLRLRIGGSIANGTQKKISGSEKDGTRSFFAAFGVGGTPRRADSGTVFVAGASGRLGIRIVRELAAAGFRVRAGVRSEEKAEKYAEQLAELGETVGPLSQQDANRVKVVFCDLEDPESIAPAIGNASRVVCAVGAAGTDFFDVTSPKRIDFEGTEQLIEESARRGVQQFVLVTSLATGKFGLPAGILNAFGAVLVWKRKAEEALERSGLPYLIVRPGGLERPKDDFKETHNVKLASRDTLFGGQVSRLQVAELITAALVSPELAENKTIEVVAETNAPFIIYEALLGGIPTEMSQELREETLAMAAELREGLDEARAALEAGRESLAVVRESIAEMQADVGKARAAVKEAQTEQGAVIKEAEKTQQRLQKLRADAEQKALLANAAKAVALEAQRAQREIRVLKREEIAAARDAVLRPTTREEQTPRKQAPLAGFFVRPQPATVTNEGDDEVEEEPKGKASRSAGPSSAFGDFFGGTLRLSVAPPQELGEERQEEIAAPAAQEKSAQGFLSGISNFFQPQGTVYIDEAPEQAKEIESIAPPAPKAAGRTSIRSISAKAKADVALKKEAAGEPEVQTTAGANPPADTKLSAFSFPQFGSFQLPSFTMPSLTTFENEPEPDAKTAQDVEAEAAAAEATRAAEEAAATRRQEALMEQQESERRAVELLEKERAAHEAELRNAPPRAEAPVTQSQQASETFSAFFGSLKMPWQTEAGAGGTPQAESSSSSSDTPPDVAEARAWTEELRERSATTGNSEANGLGGSDTQLSSAEVAANVQAARDWIEAWRSRN